MYLSLSTFNVLLLYAQSEWVVILKKGEPMLEVICPGGLTVRLPALLILVCLILLCTVMCGTYLFIVPNSLLSGASPLVYFPGSVCRVELKYPGTLQLLL